MVCEKRDKDGRGSEVDSSVATVWLGPTFAYSESLEKPRSEYPSPLTLEVFKGLANPGETGRHFYG